MEVDAASFPHHLLGILIAVSEADFVSFDLEMSGIPSRMPGRVRSAKKQSLEDRYLEVKAGAEAYQILQVGITCARFDYVENKYILRPYNINISPFVEPRLDFERDVTFQTGAVRFLLDNGFKMDLPFTKGVPYLSRDEADKIKTHQYARFEKKNEVADLQLKDTDVDSLDFVRRVREAVKAWQKTATEAALYITTHTGLPASEQPNVSVISRFEKRLIHQLVRAEFSHLVTMGRNDCIKVIPYNAEREADNTRYMKRRVKEQISNATGFRWIIEAMAMSRGDVGPLDPMYFACGPDGQPIAADLEKIKTHFRRAVARMKDRKMGVLVGHNMFADIVYLYRTFIGELPPTLDEFRSALHEVFPRIVDTKYLATYDGGDLNVSPTLQEVAEGLEAQELPDIVTHAEHTKYHNTTAFHEAGYDSLLTATILLRLTAKIHVETKEAAKLATPEVDSDADSKLSFRTADETPVPPPALVDGREHVQAPVPLPPVVQVSDIEAPSQNGKKKRNRKKKKAASSTTEPTAAPTSTPRSIPNSQPSRFGMTNVFDALETAVQSSSTSAVKYTWGPTEVSTALNPPVAFDGEDTNGYVPPPADSKFGDWRDTPPLSSANDYHTPPKIERKAMEMIPDFDSEASFWDKFGNRLRVFGTEEKVLRIAEWGKVNEDDGQGEEDVVAQW